MYASFHYLIGTAFTTVFILFLLPSSLLFLPFIFEKALSPSSGAHAVQPPAHGRTHAPTSLTLSTATSNDPPTEWQPVV